jgi:hypothetical protein
MTADVAGGTQAAASLDKTTEAAKKAGGATEDLADQTKKLAPAQEETTKSARGLGEAHREMHRLMHQVTEQSPVLGLAMKAAFSPIGAAVMAAGIALRFAAEAEAESLRKAMETAERVGRGFGDMTGPMRDATAAANESQAAYDTWASHLGKDFNALSKELDNEIAKLHADAAAQRELIEAQKAAALARLELAKAAGQVAPEDYEARKAQIEGGARRAGMNVDRAAEVAEIAKREKTLEETKKQQAAAKAEADALQAREGAPETKMMDAAAARLKNQAAEAARLAEEAKGKMPAAQEAAAEARENASGFFGKFGPKAIGEAMTDFAKLPFTGEMPLAPVQKARKADEDVAKLAKQHDEEAKLAAKSADEAARLSEARKKEQEELAEAKKKTEELTAAMKAQSDALERLKAETAARERYRPQIEQSKEVAENAGLLTKLSKTPGGGAAESDVSAAASTAKALEQHKQVSDQSKQQLVDIASAISVHRVSLQEAVKMMAMASKDIGAFTADVLKLAQAMGVMASAQRDLGGRVSYVEDQVRALGNQMRGVFTP